MEPPHQEDRQGGNGNAGIPRREVRCGCQFADVEFECADHSPERRDDGLDFYTT
jgi:hypothetical protein